MLLRPPFASNCDAALNDHKCATLLFWYWATRPGDSVANSVTTCELVGSSFNSSEVMTVPDVAEVVSMSGVPELTSTLFVVAPTSSWTSISLSSAVCRRDAAALGGSEPRRLRSGKDPAVRIQRSSSLGYWLS